MNKDGKHKLWDERQILYQKWCFVGVETLKFLILEVVKYIKIKYQKASHLARLLQDLSQPGLGFAGQWAST